MSEQKSNHHFRFYIIMITIVVAVIFLFLVLNDDSALSGATLLNGAKEDSGQAVEITGASITSSNSLARSAEKEIALIFDQIPDLKKEAKFETFEIRFENLGTGIKVNDDRLELNNLEEVTLRVEDFSGEILLSGTLFSMDGKAKLIEVNDVALYSKDSLEIAFNDLGYDYLNIQEIEMADLELPQGDGSLQVTDKLTYALADESLELNYFKGQLLIGAIGNNTLDNSLSLNGVIKGLSLSGPTLNLVIS